MSKKILVEVNMFAKILSIFYDKRAKGKSSEFKKSINKSDNPELARLWNAWENDSEKLLIATRNLLVKSGLNTDKVDALIDKYHNK